MGLRHASCNHVSNNLSWNRVFHPCKCATTRWSLLASFAYAQDTCRDDNTFLQSLGWRYMCPPVKGKSLKASHLIGKHALQTSYPIDELGIDKAALLRKPTALSPNVVSCQFIVMDRAGVGERWNAKGRSPTFAGGFGCSSSIGTLYCPVSCGKCEESGVEAPVCDEDE
eukprot:6472454-Amphidinium_carterae.1